MYKELSKQKLNFRFGKAELWLRYDIEACMNIENAGFLPLDILSVQKNAKAVRVFLTNGLSDWYRNTEREAELSEIVNALMKSGSSEIINAISEAVLLAHPRPALGNAKKTAGGHGDMRSMQTLYCDVMGKSDESFMRSTFREALERWERYAEATGRKKPVEVFNQYDD